MIAKFKKARSIKGTKFIHLLAACPTGWRMPENLSVEVMRLAVLTNYFPLYEVENGETYRQTVDAGRGYSYKQLYSASGEVQTSERGRFK